MKSVGFFICVTALIIFQPAFADMRSAYIIAEPISSFDLRDTKKTRFGLLEFVGGLALRSPNRHFGALSGLRVGNKGQFTAVTDTGFWLSGKIVRNSSGRPGGLSELQVAPLLDQQGQPFSSKWQADAEGLTFSGSSAYVSTEQDTRIMKYENTASLLQSSSVRVTSHFPEGVFGYNNGLEAIAAFPATHAFHGDLIALRERAQKVATENSPIPGFILRDQKPLPVFVASHDDFSITDADFLPNGDLLILERLFSMSRGVRVRIRRIVGSAIKPNAVLNGKIIFQAGRGQQVDNMEGLSAFIGPDGHTRLALVSDNNHWLLQRNLYLEFRLVD